MTKLTQEDVHDFWLNVYFGTSDYGRLKEAAVDRAYRDFNRTMHGFGKIRQEISYAVLRQGLLKLLNTLLLNEYDQDEFDKGHKKTCEELIRLFEKVADYKISIGQAQKWVNMSLKYWFAIGEKRIPRVEKNYEYYHVPLDNIIQENFTNMALISLKQDGVE